MHETTNVLDALPKSVPGKAKKDLHAIYEAENRADAEAGFDRFTDQYGAKHDKVVTCLVKDRAALLAFYDLPAEPPSPPPRQGLPDPKALGGRLRRWMIGLLAIHGCAHFMERSRGLLAFAGDHVPGRGVAEGGHQRFSGKVGL